MDYAESLAALHGFIDTEVEVFVQAPCNAITASVYAKLIAIGDTTRDVNPSDSEGGMLLQFSAIGAAVHVERTPFSHGEWIEDAVRLHLLDGTRYVISPNPFLAEDETN
jgi:hypothetical protein